MDCEYREWDSTFFNRRIGRLLGNRLTPERLRTALDWTRAERIDCLYFLADSDDAQTIRLAEANGFRLVDIRVTLEHPLVTVSTAAEAAPNIRLARLEDVAALCAIAKVSHRAGRFYSDPEFRPRSDALYETWIEKSCNGYADAVLVAEAEQQAAGYLSCHLSRDGEGSIGLVAVDSRFQGRGLGSQLVTESLHYFRTNGMSRASVVTQGSNSASQRLYQACGFRTRSVQLWYHRWSG